MMKRPKLKYVIIATTAISLLSLAVLVPLLPKPIEFPPSPSPPTPDFPNEPINVRGNTVGNINNLGIAAIQGGWIYYYSYKSDKIFNYAHALYRIRTDCSYNSVVVEANRGSIMNINVVGNWIYFTDNTGLYRISTDGSNETLLLDDSIENVTVKGDWIYYNTIGSIPGRGYMCRIRTDGSDNNQLNEEYTFYINVEDDWIYYLVRGGVYNYEYNGHIVSEDEMKIVKVSTDGTNRTMLSDENVRSMNVQGDWIYYITSGETHWLYKIRTDGTDKKLISKGRIDCINVIGNWIYYVDGDDHGSINRIRIDGKAKTQIYTDEYAAFLQVVDKWVFFRVHNSLLYMIRTDGTGLQLVP